MEDLIVLDKETAQVRPCAKMGRPTIYNPELGQAICDHIERGLTKRAACALCEISEEVFQLWSQTRDDFITLLARAEGIAEQTFTRALHDAAVDAKAPGDWRPAVEWLKRRRRADYGDTLDVRKLDLDTLRAWYEASVEQQAAPPDPALLTEDDVL